MFFADDANVFLSSQNLHLIIHEANKKLEHVKVFFNANQLSLNVKKTHYMPFSEEKHSKTDITIDGHVLERVPSRSFL